MTTPSEPIGADYNARGSAAGKPRPLVLTPLVLLLAAVFVFRADGAITAAARRLSIAGDLRRTLETLQQFGDFATLLLAAAFIWLLDPRRRARLADLAVAAAFTWLVVQALKMLLGRPRPKFDDPAYFCGPFGVYPLEIKGELVLRHSWEFWAGISSNLWSMPSSHTAAAAVLGLFLARLYPALRWLMVAWIALVGLSRVLLGSHYAADVLAGAGVGLLAASAAIDNAWGRRLLGLERGRGDGGGNGANGGGNRGD